MILLPIKDLRKAKQRLAGVLDQAARTQLARAMIRDILCTLASWQNCPEVALVTSDPFAADLAAQYKFQVIPDLENRSETDAIERATAFCVQLRFAYPRE
jgi:2-phospho-L-lactate guanylyltransferase (CobY/MobA/RfbA family)